MRCYKYYFQNWIYYKKKTIFKFQQQSLFNFTDKNKFPPEMTFLYAKDSTFLSPAVRYKNSRISNLLFLVLQHDSFQKPSRI